MKIYLLIFDDGFAQRPERASCDGLKIRQLADELNGEGCVLGPYDVQEIELEDLSLEMRYKK